MSFTHLHVHSHYTLLTALPRIEELLARAKELGMTSLALTDTSALYGAVEFALKAKDTGIKTIFGAELYLAKDHLSKNNTAEDRRRTTLVLLVENEKGYKNLLQLISIAQLNGFYYKARIDKELLRKYHEGLIALSGSLSGEIPSELVIGDYERAKSAALELDGIFGRNNFFLELQPHLEYDNQITANQGLIQISRETGIPLVATNDVHYVNREDALTQDILLAIRDSKKVEDRDRFSMMHLDLSLSSEEQMQAAFSSVPEALENTGHIADRCHYHFTFGVNHLPRFPLPKGVTADDFLRTLAERGLTERFGHAPNAITPEHRTRMDYELDVIKTTGFASYFLIVADFVNWAKQNGIVVGPGRGSAAGSFVSYLTGITNLDPIVYNLLFERFLNPERISMPDVDMDFQDDRREDVLNYVRAKYGEDHVAQIITFGTMAARGSIRDVGRALGYPYEFCDKTAKMIPMFTSIRQALEEVTEFRMHYEGSAEAKRLIDAAQKIEGLARHASMHACGVIISQNPITEYTPLQRVAGSHAGVVTQYAASTKANAVEKIGLLKMDFLGLKNLTLINNTLRIARKIGKEVPDIDTLPMDDPSTYQVLQEARTTGVFQLESAGMKRYLKQLKPTVFEDIIAMVALYRPGPMEYIPDFIAGKHGTKKIEYLHSRLEPILKTTYGVAVYQEQLMQIARDLAGFTLGEADVLRKAVGKKIKELVTEQRQKFIDGCIRNGVPKAAAERVFSFIEPFAGYGFNRSHAACYALIGYQTAYLKAHFPAEFMAALLTSDQNDTDRIAIEVREAREIGIEVLPPDVSESYEDFAVITDATGRERIRFGLNAIKNVGAVCAAEIVAERKRGGKFTSLEDFAERIQTKDFNKKSLESLIKVGALDSFGERRLLLQNVDPILRYNKASTTRAARHEESLFGTLPITKTSIPLSPITPASQKEKLVWEKELLGLYVSDHPVRDYAAFLQQTVTPLRDIEKHTDEARLSVGGVITSLRRVITKAGDPMYFVGLEDLTGRAEILVFGRMAKEYGEVLTEDDLVLMKIRVTEREGRLRVSAEGIERLRPEMVSQFTRIRRTQEKAALKHSGVPAPPPNRILVTLAETATSEAIANLSAALHTLPVGSHSVSVRVAGATVKTAFHVTPNEATLQRLQSLPGVSAVTT